MRQLTLGEVIDRLEGVPDREALVYYDFMGCVPTQIDSSRGHYNEPALGWAPSGYSGDGTPPSVQGLLDRLYDGLRLSYSGWTGGVYRYARQSPLWVDNRGDWNETVIREVRYDGLVPVAFSVTLVTERGVD